MANKNDSAWLEHLADYSRFCSTFGRTPSSNSENGAEARLANWASNQRQYIKTNSMTPERLARVRLVAPWILAGSSSKAYEDILKQMTCQRQAGNELLAMGFNSEIAAKLSSQGITTADQLMNFYRSIPSETTMEKVTPALRITGLGDWGRNVVPKSGQIGGSEFAQLNFLKRIDRTMDLSSMRLLQIMCDKPYFFWRDFLNSPRVIWDQLAIRVKHAYTMCGVERPKAVARIYWEYLEDEPLGRVETAKVYGDKPSTTEERDYILRQMQRPAKLRYIMRRGMLSGAVRLMGVAGATVQVPAYKTLDELGISTQHQETLKERGVNSVMDLADVMNDYRVWLHRGVYLRSLGLGRRECTVILGYLEKELPRSNTNQYNVSDLAAACPPLSDAQVLEIMAQLAKMVKLPDRASG